jgi:uncharacterized repeat protein (TIGR01451 family)
VDVLNPEIMIVKTGPEVAHNGDTITYHFNVTNIGDCDLYNVEVVDPLIGTYYIGDLAQGAYVTFTMDYIIPADSTWIDNTATVTGDDGYGGDASDDDSWEVDVLNPEIMIVKTGPTVAHNGDTITYNFVVTNIGDCDLYNVEVTDPLFGATWSYWIGDLAQGASVSFDVDYIIPAGTTWIDNIATVTGDDGYGGDASDDDSWEVDVLNPAIQVVKEADKDIYHVGETVHYTITVTNIGDCILYNVVLTDALIGWTSSPITLDVGESHTYYVDYVITGNEADPFTNTVVATGEDEIGGESGTVTDEDTETIDIIHPEIDVTKTADTTYAYQGETITITYFYNVSNIGDTILYNVTVIDDILGDLTSYLPDDTLDVGEVNTFTVTVNYTIPEDSCGLTNIVTATGVDAYGWEVSDTDSWTITTLPKSQVTDTSFCVFDRDPDTPGQQFRLLFTQNPSNPGTYKLT